MKSTWPLLPARQRNTIQAHVRAVVYPLPQTAIAAESAAIAVAVDYASIHHQPEHRIIVSDCVAAAQALLDIPRDLRHSSVHAGTVKHTVMASAWRGGAFSVQKVQAHQDDTLHLLTDEGRSHALGNIAADAGAVLGGKHHERISADAQAHIQKVLGIASAAVKLF